MQDRSRPASDVVFRERWEVVTDELRARILSGEMLPGSRIIETDLAEMFGVSRGPVREALRSLESAGLVRRTARHGSYVAPVNRRDVEEIYSLRRALEELAIRRALGNAPDDTIAALERHASELSAAVAANDLNLIVECDVAFHSVFYDRSVHERLKSAWANLTDPLRILMRLSSTYTDPDWRRTIGDHERIAAAAAAADADSCVQAMHRHLVAAENKVMSYVASQEFQES